MAAVAPPGPGGSGVGSGHSATEVEAATAADPDAPPLDEVFWDESRVVVPGHVRKRHTGVRIDDDMLAWFPRKAAATKRA